MGKYKDLDDYECKSCAPCAKCINPNVCSKCLPGYYLKDLKCFDNCPTGYYNNKENGVCT